MKANSTLSFVIALIFSITFSCTKEVVVPDLEGSLVGFVLLHDEYGNLLENHDNVLVTALGTGKFTTKTDKKGRFEFKGLPAGTYEIDMEKEGFGTMKQFSVQHLGGKPTLLNQESYDYIMSAFYLYQTPTSSITNLSIENDTITATLDFNGYDISYLNFNLLVYFSGTENFEPKDAELILQPYMMSYQDVYKGVIVGLKTKFGSGKHLAYKACILIFSSDQYYRMPMEVHPIDSYFDYSLNKVVYPNLGPVSNEYAYIVP
jgi:hypothetical protein